MSNEEKSFHKSSINWYPGHMAKAKRQIKEIIDTVDIVINVVDARIPKSSLLPDTKDYVFNKQQMILMSKYDLCDKKKTDKWIKYYQRKGYEVLAFDLKEGLKLKEIIYTIEKLMVKVNIKRQNNGLLPKRAKVLIIGASNVGKSTLINRLCKKKAVKVGNTPGVTKAISTIKVNDKIDVVDTPGVLWPKIEDRETALNLAAMSIIRTEVLDHKEVAFYILERLSNEYSAILKREFGISEFNKDNVEECYKQISLKKNIPLVDGEPDYDRIHLCVINSIKSERVYGITFDNIK